MTRFKTPKGFILIKQQIQQWFYLRKLRFYQFIKKYPYCYNYDHMEQCCFCQWCQDGMPCRDLIFPPLFKKYNPDTFKGYSLEHYVDRKVPPDDR